MNEFVARRCPYTEYESDVRNSVLALAIIAGYPVGSTELKVVCCKTTSTISLHRLDTRTGLGTSKSDDVTATP